MTLDAQREQLRLREMYDVERYVAQVDRGVVVEDPYPAFAELRAQAEVHPGSVAELLGHPPRMTLRPEAPVFSTFSFGATDQVLRDNETFSSSFYAGLATPMFGRSILEMGGDEHRRYRALVQPAFTPKRGPWWVDQWIRALVDAAVSAFEQAGRAELNGDLCAQIPLQTITSSFGLTREEALDFRQSTGSGMTRSGDVEAAEARAERSADMLRRVIAARRASPEDDVITMLVEAELEEGGARHLLTDEEIFGFARLILTAGSGTTWRQLGILLHLLLRDPESLAAVRDDRELLRNAIEEAVRVEPTDPIFRRLTTRDVTLAGVDIPAGAVVEMNLGAANRDPERWAEPDRFDLWRAPSPHLGFAGGPHVCLGMHVARAEMLVAVDAVLDRLPNLRPDPDAAPPRIIGLEHRGPSRVPVVFG
jgi:cytochrome P450